MPEIEIRLRHQDDSEATHTSRPDLSALAAAASPVDGEEPHDVR